MLVHINVNLAHMSMESVEMGECVTFGNTFG